MTRERKLPAESPADARTRLQREEGERRYREYWLSLDLRDRERIPQPENLEKLNVTP